MLERLQTFCSNYFDLTGVVDMMVIIVSTLIVFYTVRRTFKGMSAPWAKSRFRELFRSSTGPCGIFSGPNPAYLNSAEPSGAGAPGPAAGTAAGTAAGAAAVPLADTAKAARKDLWTVTWKNALLIIAHAAGIYAVWLVLGLVLFLVYPDTGHILNQLPKFLTIALYAAFLNRDNVKSRIISGVTIFIINVTLIEVGGVLQGVISSVAVNPHEDVWRVSIMFFTILFAVLLRAFSVKKYQEIPWIAVIAVVLYSVMGFVIAGLRSTYMEYFSVFDQTEYYEYGYHIQLYVMITIIAIILYNLVCYFMIYFILKQYERNKMLNKEVAQLEAQEAMTRMTEENLKQMRSIRHDIKNRYAIMQSMLEQKRYDDLERYFKEINQEAIVPLSQVNSGNTSLDVVLNLEISKAVAYGITTKSRIVVPASIPVLDVDMDRLISNIYDNAIEACMKIEEGEKVISAEMSMVHDYLYIKVSNSVREDRLATALDLRTDKPDKKMHGLGSKIIDDVVAKYHGTISRTIQDRQFIVKVMLDTSQS